jgi:anti-sigma factor RsiW
MEHLILLRGHATHGTAVSEAPHLSVEELASMIDGTLPGHERERVERHLAECDACREELAASARLVASNAAVPARRFPWRNLLPLAAGILLVVWMRRPAERPRPTDASERASPAGSARITTVYPGADASVGARALRFTWRPIEGGVGYNVVVKDASGTPLWKGDAVDTTLALPDTVRLQSGVTYVWRVDGQRADGSTAASAESEFRIAP